VAPSLVRELVKPAERIGEIKVLQLGGVGNGGGTQPHLPLLGNALGPMMQTILQSSVMIPAMKELMKFVDMNAVAGAVSQAVRGSRQGRGRFAGAGQGACADRDGAPQ
jgi:flotillin-like protein